MTSTIWTCIERGSLVFMQTVRRLGSGRLRSFLQRRCTKFEGDYTTLGLGALGGLFSARRPHLSSRTRGFWCGLGFLNTLLENRHQVDDVGRLFLFGSGGCCFVAVLDLLFN